MGKSDGHAGSERGMQTLQPLPYPQAMHGLSGRGNPAIVTVSLPEEMTYDHDHQPRRTDRRPH